MSRQRDLKEHLIGKGLDDEGAAFNTMKEDLLPLMPSFLAGGGAYSRPGRGDMPIKGISRYDYATPELKLVYNSNSLVLTKETHNGYPVLVLVERSTWYTHLVHPNHLDAALCYLLGVPDNEDQVR